MRADLYPLQVLLAAGTANQTKLAGGGGPGAAVRVTQVLADRVGADNAHRAREAVERQLGSKSGG